MLHRRWLLPGKLLAVFSHALTREDAQGRPTSLALHGRGRGHHRHVPSVAPCQSCNYGNNGLQQPRKQPIDSNMTSINEHWAETQVKKAPGQAPATHDMRKCTYKEAKRRGGHPSGKQQCAPGLAPAASLSGISVAPGLAPAQRLARDRRRRGLPQHAMWQESVWRRGLPQRIGVGQESGG